MKTLSLIIVLAVLCCGCVATAEDFRLLSGKVLKIAEEHQVAAVAVSAELDAVAETLEKREKDAELTAEEIMGGAGGIAGLGFAIYKAVMIQRDKKYIVKSAAATDPTLKA